MSDAYAIDEIIERRPSPAKWYLISGCVVLLICAAVFGTYRGVPQGVSLEDIVVSPVLAEGKIESIPIEGVTMSSRIVFLDAIEDGVIRRILVDEGDTLEREQVILELENPSLMLELMNYEVQVAEQIHLLTDVEINITQQASWRNAEISRQRRDVHLARAELDRVTELFNDGYISKKEYVEAQQNLAHAQEVLEINKQTQARETKFWQSRTSRTNRMIAKLESNLVKTQERAESLVLRAPLEGKLTNFDLKPGAAVSRGQRLGAVEDVTNPYLEAFVDEYHIDRIRDDLKAEFRVGGDMYTAKIVKVYPQVSQRRVKVDLKFDQEDFDVAFVGQTIHGVLSLAESKPSLQLQAGAYLEQTGGRWVFKVSEDGLSALRTPVELSKSGHDQVRVIKGLQVGDRVVTSSYDGRLNKQRISLNSGGI